MKRDRVLTVILFCMVAVLPVGLLLLHALDYRLVAQRPLIPAIVGAAVFAVLSVPLLNSKEPQGKLTTVLRLLMLPLAVIDLYVVLFWSSSIPVTLLAVVFVVFSMVLVVCLKKPFGWQLTSGIVSAVLILPFASVAGMYFFFGSLGQNTVVKTVPSPDGTYCAEVIDSDHGATGGDTLVEIYESGASADLYFVRLEKNRQQLYVGDWGEFETMDIQWESENILLIDGNIYHIL